MKEPEISEFSLKYNSYIHHIGLASGFTLNDLNFSASCILASFSKCFNCIEIYVRVRYLKAN